MNSVPMSADAAGRAAVELALVNLDAFFDGGAEELDYVDRARDELRRALGW